ncbi:MAG: 4'-phosphopantetheinyl transferase superfamily protein [Proteobacteria bacterium]|nr:4'-phosphopantetheinyl transferase superfamily protein [Pseudomonadota bacterium]
MPARPNSVKLAAVPRKRQTKKSRLRSTTGPVAVAANAAMIAGTARTRTARPRLWLAVPPRAPAPPPRRLGERALRARLVAHLAGRGIALRRGPGVSHAGGHVGYLHDPAGAGLDLEWIRPRDAVALARRAYSPAEARRLAALPAARQAAAFIELWVLKEAAGKALGLDLFAALARCRFEVSGGRIRGRVPGRRRWCAALYAPRPLLRLAWFAPDGGPEPVAVEWSAATGRERPARWHRIATGGTRRGGPR